MKSLTPKQQQLVADNHNLIYSLANYKHINLDEFYDVLAIGLCKAAAIFDETKGNFSTIAYTVMYNEYKIQLRQLTAARTIPQDKIVSADIKIQSEDREGNPARLIDLIPDETALTEQNVMCDITYRLLMDKLKEDEKEIVMMLLDGVSQVDIAKQMNFSRQYINIKIKRIRDILMQILK